MESTNRVVELNDKGRPIVRITYPAYTTDLQLGITSLMDRCVLRVGNCTLAELGYLHRSEMVMTDAGEYHLRVYFDARHATRPDQVNPRKRVPVKALTVFRDYMYVGEIAKAIHIDTMVGPRTRSTMDELGRPSLEIIDQDDNVETSVLVLECNIYVTLAAMADVSLFDPAFRVIPTTSGNRAVDQSARIVRAIDREVPVSLTLEYSDGVVDSFDPNEAVTYLRAKRRQAADGQQAERRVREEVAADAGRKRREAGRQTAFGKWA